MAEPESTQQHDIVLAGPGPRLRLRLRLGGFPRPSPTTRHTLSIIHFPHGSGHETSQAREDTPPSTCISEAFLQGAVNLHGLTVQTPPVHT